MAYLNFTFHIPLATCHQYLIQLLLYYNYPQKLLSSFKILQRFLHYPNNMEALLKKLLKRDFLYVTVLLNFQFFIKVSLQLNKFTDCYAKDRLEPHTSHKLTVEVFITYLQLYYIFHMYYKKIFHLMHICIHHDIKQREPHAFLAYSFFCVVLVLLNHTNIHLISHFKVCVLRLLI